MRKKETEVNRCEFCGEPIDGNAAASSANGLICSGCYTDG